MIRTQEWLTRPSLHILAKGSSGHGVIHPVDAAPLELGDKEFDNVCYAFGIAHVCCLIRLSDTKGPSRVAVAGKV